MPFVNAAAAPLVVGGDKVPVSLMGGKVRCSIAEFTFATDATGTYSIPELQFPAGARILDVACNTDTSTSTATFSLGISGSTAKYRAMLALTAVNMWAGSSATLPGGNLNAATGVALTAAESWIMTTAAATMPASGRMLIRVLWVDNS
ncbi:MAG: hypothetical protein IT555_10980 [Acetobacteraceae bacterium]|nr:hypothetical protein [Acetobacteraceae bacterium]